MVNVEYLVAFNIEAGLCKSPESFKSLIKSNDRISIKGNKITFEGDTFPIKIHHGDIQEDKLKYFHLIISAEEENIKILGDLCKEIRKILGKICEGNRIQTLWDGIGFSLCKAAYPVIYEVENLLRKLITKFMLCNVGLSWHKESLPSEVRDSIKSKSGRDSATCLYEADFIQLANFLFKPYSDQDMGLLFQQASELGASDSISKEDLDRFIPRSNWDRFFSDVVSCEKGFIEKRWDRLYQLRCMVAHNKQFTFRDYDEVIELSGELKPKFEEALDNLENVEVPPEEKEQVAESIARSRSESYRNFLKDWNDTCKSIAKISKFDILSLKYEIPERTKLISDMLIDKNLINKSVVRHLENIEELRNSLVHDINIKIPDNVLDKNIMYLDSLRDDIELKINSPIPEEVAKNDIEDAEKNE